MREFPEDLDQGEGRKLFEADWWGIWEKYRFVGIFLLGFLTLGVLAYLSFWSSEPEIEVLPAAEEETAQTLFADLEGAVERPGLYELPAGSRVNDLLVKAGGLSAQADREWAAKNLNLALGVVDGAKIYIPTKGEAAGGGTLGLADSAQVNLNTASAGELDALTGIGEKRAADIVAGRPYQKIEELVEKKIVPASVFEKIKDQVTVY